MPLITMTLKWQMPTKNIRLTKKNEMLLSIPTCWGFFRAFLYKNVKLLLNTRIYVSNVISLHRNNKINTIN